MEKFVVERLTFQDINELPNSWQHKDYLALLEKMGYENPEEIREAELKAMCMMSFTDFEPSEAAQVVLEYQFSKELNEGQIENLAHQMLTEKLWEEYPELPLHTNFYKATQLLFEAYNGKFPRPEAVQFQIKVTADTPESMSVFDENPEPPLLRLLARGLGENSLINRLFSEQMEGEHFPEAKAIIWQLNTLKNEKKERVFEVISSSYWLEDFKYADTYQASTHADSMSDQEPE